MLVRRKMMWVVAALAFAAGHAAAQAAPGGAAQVARPEASNAAPAAQLHLPVPLVVEDVVVLDRNGTPVHGLKAADLTVSEDGKAVAVRSFEEHIAQQPAALPKQPDLGPNVFTNVQTVPNTGGSLYVLLLDALNTPLLDQVYARQQMLKFLKSMPPGMRVAVFGLGTRLYLLQGFTSNPEILEAAIAAKRRKGRGSSPLLENPVSGEPVEQMSDAIAENLDTSAPEAALTMANVEQFEAENQTAVARLRMIYTLEAMNELARYLSAFQGRKNVIWFSGSFPLNIFPDESLTDPFGAMADFQEDVRKTTDLMARSRVAIYPVDARGLFGNPAFNASQSGAGLMARMRTNPGVFAAANNRFLTQTATEHATMDVMADATGGKAFYNTNGLKEAIDKVASYGENYYTVAYTPPDHPSHGDYRKIAIRCNQPGVHLEYRKGYVTDIPGAPSEGLKVLPQNAMAVAMLRGGPKAAQIQFDVMAIPADATGDQFTKGTRPDAQLMKPPYRSYTLQYLVDIRGAAFSSDSKAVRHGALEFAAFLYDQDGQLFNSADSGLKLTLPPEQYMELAGHGLLVRQTIEVPVKGEYFLRVGVHDLTGDRVGTVEIPVAGLKSRQALREALSRQQQAAPAK